MQNNPGANQPAQNDNTQGSDNRPRQNNNPQGSGNQARPQGSDNQVRDNQQRSDNRPGSNNNPQVSGNQGRPSNQQGSGNQRKPNNPQGSSNQVRDNQQRSDNRPSSTNNQQGSSNQARPKGQGNQPKSNNQQRSDNRPGSNPQGSGSQGNRPRPNINQPEPEQFQQMSISSGKQQQPQNAPEVPKSVPTASKKASNQGRDEKAIAKDTTQESAQSSSQQLTVYKSSPATTMPHLLCPYKGPGSRGMRFKSLLETNYLKLKIDNMKKAAYHYDVQIEPDKPKKHMSKIFQQFCENNFPSVGIAFDGARNAYAPLVLKLDNIERQVNFTHPETGGIRTYLVSIKETDDMVIPLDSLKTYHSTRQYDMPKRALQCIEIILKGAYQQRHLEMGIQAARSFYMPPRTREYLGDFFELWLSLFQSTVLGSQIYLNVDVAHKAFPERYASLVDLLNQIEREYKCDQRYALDDMRSHLSGLDVIYKTPGNAGQLRVYKFFGLVGTPVQERFTDANGREVTVAAYFREQNYPINYPNLPCVKLGNTIKSITVPMEHCSLSDRQAINRKCTENQTRNIIKFAATSTDVRKNKILSLVNEINHNQSPIIRGFGLQLDMNFAKVQGRCLEAPKIQYAGNRLVEVKNGVWRGEGMPFLIPESANKWAILNANQRTRNDELQDLARMLLRTSASTNLNLAEKPLYIRPVDNRNFANIQKELEKAKEDGIRILFCVIPDAGPTYAKIKQLAETRIGVLTQCIKGTTVFKKRTDGSTISNILLKVNAKLNGSNHRLNDSPILKDKCMLIGADVTHPSPDQKQIPSVVGVAASHDANAFCYNVCWRLQGPRIEIIEEFRQITLEHLKYYRQKNGCLPNKILYYRDGVSEGQFQQVMASEKMAMTQACAEIEPGYEKKVKLTIIVVQKRHHTRFFPGQTEIGRNDRRNNNVPAGTIVDTEIVHPNENHFYLVSHQSIQGVAKPTKYCILLDEANHSIDDLQGLSYNLCHLFSRCNRSVSYPAPTYYAHLAAYRGRVYIENDRINMNRLPDEWRNRAIRDDIAKVHPMFFV